MEFRPASGNAGTGMCQRGACEHGCEFAPVASEGCIMLYVASELNGLPGYARFKLSIATYNPAPTKQK